VLKRTVKEGRLGQHREGRRSPGLVLQRDGDRVIAGREDPLRRRTALALRDHVEPAGDAKGGLEAIAAGRGRCRPPFERRQRLGVAPGFR
jgi:hypothetical protein